MPITPFHFGIGLFAKGIAPRKVSFTGFCLTQIAIDCESGYFLLRGEWPVHRFFHTFLGASLLCGATCLIALPLLTRVSRRLARDAGSGLEHWLDKRADPGAWTLLATASLGLFGHVIPDAIMHSDSRPFAPVSDANPFHGLFSLGVLHGGLIVIGVIGVIGYLLTTWRASAR